MENDITLLMEKFEERLYLLVNHSALPIGIVYFFMKKVTKELENIYNNSLNDNKEEGFEIPIELNNDLDQVEETIQIQEEKEIKENE